uniref:Uncharacterized protein n=1 Tax=Anopheles minimus TaxID=112268 RepID=A0A182WPM3_9DIPT
MLICMLLRKITEMLIVSKL